MATDRLSTLLFWVVIGGVGGLAGWVLPAPLDLEKVFHFLIAPMGALSGFSASIAYRRKRDQIRFGTSVAAGVFVALVVCLCSYMAMWRINTPADWQICVEALLYGLVFALLFFGFGFAGLNPFASADPSAGVDGDTSSEASPQTHKHVGRG